MPTNAVHAGIVASCLALAALSGCAGDDAPAVDVVAPLERQDCLVILLDALHAPNLGCYGARAGVSPAIDRLATTGTRFTKATSQASWTLPSTVSLFTGTYQQTHGVTFGVGLEPIKLADEAFTLAERFADAGYATAAFTQNPFAGRHWGLAQGFETFEEIRSDGVDMADLVLEHLADPDEDRPRFTYAHFRRPHTPYDPDERWLDGLVDDGYAGSVTGTDEDVEAHNSGRRAMETADLMHHRGLYLGNIRQVDDAVGRLLAGVDRSRTLVVLLSDHGEAFGQHGQLGHNWASYQEYVHIPLIVSHPDLPRNVVDDEPVMTIDVVPTFVDLFGLARDGLIDQGRSFAPRLADDASDDDARFVFTASRLDGRGERQVAASDGTWKYIRDLPAGIERLFHLGNDPRERDDRVDEHPELVATLRDAVDAWLAEQTPTFVTAADGELDPASIERLRELGYLPPR